MGSASSHKEIAGRYWLIRCKQDSLTRHIRTDETERRYCRTQERDAVAAGGIAGEEEVQRRLLMRVLSLTQR